MRRPDRQYLRGYYPGMSASHTNPKRKRGPWLAASLTLRVNVPEQKSPICSQAEHFMRLPAAAGPGGASPSHQQGYSRWFPTVKHPTPGGPSLVYCTGAITGVGVWVTLRRAGTRVISGLAAHSDIFLWTKPLALPYFEGKFTHKGRSLFAPIFRQDDRSSSASERLSILERRLVPWPRVLGTLPIFSSSARF